MANDLIDQIGADALVAFLEANGLDADEVPARGSVEIVGNTIRYRTYAHDDDGLLVQNPHGRGPLLTSWRSTPLRVRPQAVSRG